jgi:hypothetical protein
VASKVTETLFRSLSESFFRVQLAPPKNDSNKRAKSFESLPLPTIDSFWELFTTSVGVDDGFNPYCKSAGEVFPLACR